MQSDRFEWDDEKARDNTRKHKIRFDDAIEVFDDPLALDDIDDTMDYGEERFRVVGLVNAVLVTVFYTVRGNRIRIISARPATRTEERAYADPQ